MKRHDVEMNGDDMLIEDAIAEAVALLDRWRFHDRTKCQAELCWETDAWVAKQSKGAK